MTLWRSLASKSPWLLIAGKLEENPTLRFFFSLFFLGLFWGRFQNSYSLLPLRLKRESKTSSCFFFFGGDFKIPFLFYPWDSRRNFYLVDSARGFRGQSIVSESFQHWFQVFTTLDHLMENTGMRSESEREFAMDYTQWAATENVMLLIAVEQ